jgi:hypothetical protein
MKMALEVIIQQVTIIASDAITVVKGINGSSCSDEIALEVQDCIFYVMNLFTFDGHVKKRALHHETCRLVHLAKVVGSKTWRAKVVGFKTWNGSLPNQSAVLEPLRFVSS